MDIQIITRPVNNSEYIDWLLKHSDHKLEYDTFIDEMTSTGISESRAKQLWSNIFGDVPKDEPNKIYQCNVYDQELKMVFSILRENNTTKGDRFRVFKLNRVYVDTNKYVRRMNKDSHGKIEFIPTNVAVDIDDLLFQEYKIRLVPRSNKHDNNKIINMPNNFVYMSSVDAHLTDVTVKNRIYKHIIDKITEFDNKGLLE